MDTIAPSVTEDDVTALVARFYELVRADDRLGPIFDAAIADWDEHLQIMRDFWSAVLLRTTRYRGCVMSPHFRMPIRPTDFDRWLELFRPSARETLSPAGADQAIAIAEALTERMRQMMTAHPR